MNNGGAELLKLSSDITTLGQALVFQASYKQDQQAVDEHPLLMSTPFFHHWDYRTWKSGPQPLQVSMMFGDNLVLESQQRLPIILENLIDSRPWDISTRFSPRECWKVYTARRFFDSANSCLRRSPENLWDGATNH